MKMIRILNHPFACIIKSILWGLLMLTIISSCLLETEEVVDDSSDSCYQNILTKVITDNLYGGVTVKDVENYLLYRLDIPQDHIVNIDQYDLDKEGIYIFIVNLRDGHWFLFSGDFSSTPILAEGETGGFYIQEPLSSHDKQWFDSIKNYIQKNKQSVSDQIKQNQIDWGLSSLLARVKAGKREGKKRDGIDTNETEATITVDTLLFEDYNNLTQTQWDQDAPWNESVPKYNDNYRCLAGCAVIAIAQLLYYTHYAFGFPNAIYANASCNDYYYDGPPYNWSFSNMTTASWDYMSLGYSAYTFFDPYMPALCAYIAKLSNTAYEYVPNVQYNYTETIGATHIDSIPPVLASFLLTGANRIEYGLTNSTVISLIENEIKNQRPVLCGGFSGASELTGHSFLIDGYYSCLIQYTETTYDMEGHILSQNVYYTNRQYWRINTGNSSCHRITDNVYGGTYYPWNRYIYVGWSQN